MNTQKEIDFGNGVKIIAKEDPVKKLKEDLILLYKLDYDMNDILLTIENSLRNYQNKKGAKIMACDCLEKSIDKLRIHYGDPEGETDAPRILYPKTGKVNTRWPYLVFKYRPKKKNGSFYKYKERVNITAPYCPLCGKKYEEYSKKEPK